MDGSTSQSEYAGLAGCEELDAALLNLEATSPPEPKEIAKAARAVTGAADDAELNALETRDRELRALMLRRVQEGRIAAHNARKKAREIAMKKARNGLIPSEDEVDLSKNRFAKLLPPEIVNEHRARFAKKNGQDDEDSISDTLSSSKSSAQQVNQDINESLRRTTALVENEVQRSRAAANVVADSTRTLGRTRDQHKIMSTSIKSGGKTLRRLGRSEMMANIVVAISFAFFFIVAGYVTSRRLRSSFVASAVIRPTASVIKYPFIVMVKSARLARRKIFPASTVPRTTPMQTLHGSSSPTSSSDSGQSQQASKYEDLHRATSATTGTASKDRDPNPAPSQPTDSKAKIVKNSHAEADGRGVTVSPAKDLGENLVDDSSSTSTVKDEV